MLFLLYKGWIENRDYTCKEGMMLIFIVTRNSVMSKLGEHISL